MSMTTSPKSSVVASPAPSICEALHLSNHISPGLARGRLKNKVNPWRSELRKLRNKVYVRMFSGQCAVKCLSSYQAQAQAFIKAQEGLSKFEVDCVKRRLKQTEQAVAASGEAKAPVFGTSSYQSKVSILSSDFPSMKNVTSSRQSKVSNLSSGSTSLKSITSTVGIAIDAVSEALATSSEHSALIDSFIREATDIINAVEENSNNVMGETTNNNLTPSSEICEVEEKPFPPIVAQTFPNLEYKLPVLEQAGRGGHHLLQAGQVFTQVPHGDAVQQGGPGGGGYHPLKPCKVLPPVSPGGVVQKVNRTRNLWNLVRLNCDWPLH